MKKVFKLARRFFSNTQGSVLTDTYISLFLMGAVVFVGFVGFGGMAKKYTLMQNSENIKRIIETDGKYDSAEQQKIANYLTQQNLGNVQVTVTPSKDKYNLNEEFSVTLSNQVNLASTQIPFNVDINGHSKGRCEVYKK